VVISERGLKEGKLEYQGRRDAQPSTIASADVLTALKAKLGS